jgi:superfamily I DNA and RNA helicase
MEINLDEKRLQNDVPSWEMIRFLRDNSSRLKLDNAQLYYDFPVLKDSDDNVIIAKLLLLSQNHGVIVISALDITATQNTEAELTKTDGELEHVFSLIYSKLIRTRQLRKSRTELMVPTNAIIFAPNLDTRFAENSLEANLLFSTEQLEAFLATSQIEPIDSTYFNELISTIEGAKGIIRVKPREVERLAPTSKGVLANKIESEIVSFDRQQKHGGMVILDGFQRIRGLAGSGKTIILAMKAALTHLRNPEARILYTFYTKGLYQHIKRLITRFYRQFEDSDPDWTRLHILHGWGGYSGEGVYFNACMANNVKPISFREAKYQGTDPFDYACTTLLQSVEVQPAYDYILVDEGQDFPASFIKLCIKLAVNNRVIFAYDDLQTIFQAASPSVNEIVGVDKNQKPLVDLTEDVVLYKCYRNPREILLIAHALGFGIYSNIVQMLENKDQWTDLGYTVIKGDFITGSDTEIERPKENSLPTISMNQTINEIVKAIVYNTFDDEINSTVKNIKADIEDGLRPDDILVICVDDRNAKNYLSLIASKLNIEGIGFNNLHDDSYGIRDFYKESQVTLSTVHKAKGNEAFMVYILGVDALYTTYASVRERNILFTAMTRAKGWVRISGIGTAAEECKKEIETALENFPFLRFKYPSPPEIKTIKRDLAEKAERKQKAERKLDDVLMDMSPDEVRKFLEQRSIKKTTGTTEKKE